MDISIIVCTRNRSADLPDVVKSVWQQQFNGKLELILVDNASNDSTSSVVRSLAEQSPIPMHYIFEPIQGLSQSRNTGAKAAKGKILVFLDDDAIAQKGWLSAYWHMYESNLRIWAIGGKIELLWLNAKPTWLTSQMEISLSKLDLGETAQEMGKDQCFVGANFSCRRDILEKVGGFSIRHKLYGDERYLYNRICEEDGLIMYAPGAVVWHKVNPYRLKRRYFLKRTFLQGEADYFHGLQNSQQSVGFRIVLFYSKTALIQVIKNLFDSTKSFYKFQFWNSIAYALGRLRGSTSQLFQNR